MCGPFLEAVKEYNHRYGTPAERKAVERRVNTETENAKCCSGPDCEFKRNPTILSTKLGKDSIFYKTATKATRSRTRRATRKRLPKSNDWGAHNGA